MQPTKPTSKKPFEASEGVQAIFFDLDGVLIDSEHIHCEAWLAMAQKYGVQGFTLETYTERYLGVSDDRVAQNVFGGQGVDLFKIVQDKISYFLKKVKDVKISESVRSFIKLYGHQIPLGVVTNCTRRECDGILKAISIYENLKFSVSFNEVRRPKPHPDPYLKAIQLLNTNQSPPIPVNSIMVFEDSQVGAESARAAGIGHVHQVHFGDFSIAKILAELAIGLN
jgi:beta-phosphoglucomutase-like phosphatase (HAD superfamily)